MNDARMEEKRGYTLKEQTREEIEYQRFLRRSYRRRKKRRQLMVRRIIAGVIALMLLAGIFFLLRIAFVSFIGGLEKGDKAKSATGESVEPAYVNIPEGYEELYSSLLTMKAEYPAVEQIFMNFSSYPRDILELAVNNPETMDFVADYPKHIGDKEAMGSVTADEIADGIPLFMQWDKRWGYLSYGSNVIAISGCGPTCMSMVYSGLTKKTDMPPDRMAEYSLEHNYYDSASGTSWTMMLSGALDLGIYAEKISVGKESIKRELEAGHPVICSMKPGDFTTQGHFVVLRGIDDKGKIILNDPNSLSRSEKHWSFKKITSQTKAAWSYSYDKKA